jgi:hypothetical protein
MENIILLLNNIRKKIKEYAEENKIQFTTYDIGMEMDLEFPILEMDSDIELGKCSIHGCTYIDAEEWLIVKQGIKIGNPETIKITRMLICLKNKKNEFLPLPAIIHTFLHELAHTITIPEKIIAKNISNKMKKIQPTVKSVKKNAYMQNHHSDNFYGNFAKILRIAEVLEIYVLPKTHRNFQLRNLQRYDSLVNPSDLMSIGTTKLKI